jgi:hypothetical protein
VSSTSGSIKFFARLPPDLESLAGGFPIDYTKQVSKIFEDVTKFLVNTDKSLEILDVFGDRRYLEIKVASWGIDWSGEREPFGLSRCSLEVYTEDKASYYCRNRTITILVH